MGKMKALAIDMMEQQEQHEDFDVLMEEMHYHNTINAFVELVIMYGSAKVLDDLDKALLGAKEWLSHCVYLY